MYSLALTVRSCMVTGAGGAGAQAGPEEARPALCITHKLRRLAEQPALQQQELALTTIPAIVTVLLLDGRVVYQNPRSQRYLGSLVSTYTPPPGASLAALGACGHPLAGMFRLDAEALAAFEEAIARETEFRRIIKVPKRCLLQPPAVATAATPGSRGVSAAAARVLGRSRTARERPAISRLMRQGSGPDAAAAAGGSAHSARSGGASPEASFSRISPVSSRSLVPQGVPSRKGTLCSTAASRAASGVFSRRSSVLLPLTASAAASTTGATLGGGAEGRRLAPPSAAAAGGVAAAPRRHVLRRCTSMADVALRPLGSPAAPTSCDVLPPHRHDRTMPGHVSAAAAAPSPRQRVEVGAEQAQGSPNAALTGAPRSGYDTVTVPMPCALDGKGDPPAAWADGLPSPTPDRSAPCSGADGLASSGTGAGENVTAGCQSPHGGSRPGAGSTTGPCLPHGQGHDATAASGDRVRIVATSSSGGCDHGGGGKENSPDMSELQQQPSKLSPRAGASHDTHVHDIRTLRAQAQAHAQAQREQPLPRSDATSHLSEVMPTGSVTCTAASTCVFSDCMLRFSAGTSPAALAGDGFRRAASAGLAALGGGGEHPAAALGGPDGASPGGDGGWAANRPASAGHAALQGGVAEADGAPARARSNGSSPLLQPAHEHRQAWDAAAQDFVESPFTNPIAPAMQAVPAAPASAATGALSPRGSRAYGGILLAAGATSGDGGSAFAPVLRTGHMLSSIQEESNLPSGGSGDGERALPGVLQLLHLPPEAASSAGSIPRRQTPNTSGDGRCSSPHGGGGFDADSTGAESLVGVGGGGDSSSACQVPSLPLTQVGGSGGGAQDRRTQGRTIPGLPSLNLGMASGVLDSGVHSGVGDGSNGVATLQALSAAGGSVGGNGAQSALTAAGSSAVFQGFCASPDEGTDGLHRQDRLPHIAIHSLAAAARQVQLHPPCVAEGAPMTMAAGPGTGTASALPSAGALAAAAVTAVACGQPVTVPGPSVSPAATGAETEPCWWQPCDAAGLADVAHMPSQSAAPSAATAGMVEIVAAVMPTAATSEAAMDPAEGAFTAPVSPFTTLGFTSREPSAHGPGPGPAGQRSSSHPQLQLQSRDPTGSAAASLSQSAAAAAATAAAAPVVIPTRCGVTGSATLRPSRLGMSTPPDAASSTASNATQHTAPHHAPLTSPGLRDLEAATFSIDRGRLRVRHVLDSSSVGGRSSQDTREASLLLELRGSSGADGVGVRGGGGGSHAGGSRREVEQVLMGLGNTAEIERLLLGCQSGQQGRWQSGPGGAAGAGGGTGGGAVSRMRIEAEVMHKTWAAGDLVEEGTQVAASVGAARTPHAGGSTTGHAAVAAPAAAGGTLFALATCPLPDTAAGDTSVAGGRAATGGGGIGGGMGRTFSVSGFGTQLDASCRGGSGSVRHGGRRPNTRDRLQRLLSSVTPDGSEDEEAGDEAEWHDVTACVQRDAASGQALVVITQTVVSDQVEVQRKLEALLEHEHKVLESIFPRHVIEHMTLQAKHRSAAAGAAGAAGAGGAASGQLASDWAQFRGSAMEALATSHRCVTVLFCDIVGFTEMCKQVSAMVVMRFLNTLYMRFDELIDIYGVYKVETIGDCYMVAGGLVRTDGEGGKTVIDDGSEDALHAVRVMSFAKAVMREAADVLLPTTGEPVKLRIGLHSGPVMSGIVGDKMPRFCLFGDTVNTASRMESTCPPGSIHVSTDTRALLSNEAWAPSGGVFVKGKGVLETYVWAGHGAEDDEETERRLKVYL